MGKKKNGFNRSNPKKSPKKKSNSRKETRPKARREFLVNSRTSTKSVGRKKAFKLSFTSYKTRIKRRDFNSEAFKQELVSETKKFRKKFKTTKTRVIAEVSLRRAGKTRWQKISIGRAEFGNVNQRIEDTITALERAMRGYAKMGLRIGHIRNIQLGRVAKATRKKKRRK